MASDNGGTQETLEEKIKEFGIDMACATFIPNKERSLDFIEGGIEATEGSNTSANPNSDTTAVAGQTSSGSIVTFVADMARDYEAYNIATESQNILVIDEERETLEEEPDLNNGERDV